MASRGSTLSINAGLPRSMRNTWRIGTLPPISQSTRSVIMYLGGGINI